MESRSLQLEWEPPAADNGAFVMGYSAESRQGQGKSWQLLYSGRDTCCQVGHAMPHHNVFAALALNDESTASKLCLTSRASLKRCSYLLLPWATSEFLQAGTHSTHCVRAELDLGMGKPLSLFIPDWNTVA